LLIVVVLVLALPRLMKLMRARRGVAPAEVS